MDTTIGTTNSFIPPQRIYDGQTGSSRFPEWDGTRNGVEEAVPLDTSRPLSSFINLLNFLATTNIQILDPEDISHDESNDRETKRGNSMEVFEGDFNGKPVALKYFRWSGLDSQRRYQQSMYDLLFELKVMTHEPLCHHRNIVRAFGITFDPKISEMDDPSLTDLINPIVVAELADLSHPDLSDLFKVAPRTTFTLDVLADLISDIADGIAILHEYGLTHSDLKPGNVLIFSDGVKMIAKIGDFGAAGLEATKDKPRGRTLYWAAPESLDECPLPALRGMRVQRAHDVYAFGLIAGFIMLLGKLPLPEAGINGRSVSELKFDDVADNVVYAAVRDFWEEQLKISQAIHSILERTLRLFPNARMSSLDGIREQLTGSDPFADDKLKHKFTKRDFVQRENSLVGDIQGRNTYDTIEISPKYSVYPNMPEFLYPLLQKAGLVDSPSTKYYPRSLLGDQPMMTLGEVEDKSHDITIAEERKLREAVEQEFNLLNLREEDISTRAEPQPVDMLQFTQDCEKFRRVSGFTGTVKEYANMFMKMQICPELYQEATYLQLLEHVDAASDPEIFNIRDPRCENKTFLHATCWTRDLQTARFLLDHGADVNAIDEKGMTPLMQTFLEPFTFYKIPGQRVMESANEIPAEMTIQVAEFLISHGARFEFECKGIPLLDIIETKHFNGNKPKLVDFLIRHGHPIDSYHPEFSTPLVCAGVSRNVDSVRRLLRLGANPNVTFPKISSDNQYYRAISGTHTPNHS